MMRLLNLKSGGLLKTFTGRVYTNDMQTALSYMLNEFSRGKVLWVYLRQRVVSSSEEKM